MDGCGSSPVPQLGAGLEDLRQEEPIRRGTVRDHGGEHGNHVAPPLRPAMGADELGVGAGFAVGRFVERVGDFGEISRIDGRRGLRSALWTRMGRRDSGGEAVKR